MSSFGNQVEQYAGIYTSRASNLDPVLPHALLPEPTSSDAARGLSADAKIVDPLCAAALVYTARSLTTERVMAKAATKKTTKKSTAKKRAAKKSPSKKRTAKEGSAEEGRQEAHSQEVSA